MIHGQGPGLVEPGVIYATSNGFVWNGDGVLGLNSRTFGSYLGTSLQWLYLTPANKVSFDLAAYNGYGDTVTIEIQDPNGATVVSTTINVPDATPVPFTHTAPDMFVVTLTAGIVGIDVLGATPLGNVAFAASPSLGSFTVPAGKPCAGLVMDLAPVPALRAVIAADAAGEIHLAPFAPAAVCGHFLQVVDLTNCTTSGVVRL